MTRSANRPVTGTSPFQSFSWLVSYKVHVHYSFAINPRYYSIFITNFRKAYIKINKLNCLNPNHTISRKHICGKYMYCQLPRFLAYRWRCLPFSSCSTRMAKWLLFVALSRVWYDWMRFSNLVWLFKYE